VLGLSLAFGKKSTQGGGLKLLHWKAG